MITLLSRKLWPTLMHTRPLQKQTYIFSPLFLKQHCKIFWNPAVHHLVGNAEEKYLYTYQRIVPYSETLAGFKLNPRITTCSLTDNLWPVCSDICLHLFFSLVVSAPRRNWRSWLTWLTLWVSSSCWMLYTATHPKTQRMAWTGLMAPSPVSFTAAPVENTVSGTADSSTTLGEIWGLFITFQTLRLYTAGFDAQSQKKVNVVYFT